MPCDFPRLLPVEHTIAVNRRAARRLQTGSSLRVVGLAAVGGKRAAAHASPAGAQPLCASGLLARLALALVLRQELLAQPNRGRRDLDELVVVDELERLLEGEADRRRQDDVLVRAGRADVRELLALRRIDDEVVVAAVDADDHALVDLRAVADEER